MRSLRLIATVIVLMVYFLSLVTAYMSLIRYIFDKFQNNNRIRVVNPNIAETVGDMIMGKVNSKLCEDALCLNCVPGFCRMRPVPHPLPNLSNMTSPGFPNITTDGVQNFNIPNATDSGIQNFTAVANQVMRTPLTGNATPSPLPTIGGNTTPPPSATHAPVKQCTCSWI